MGQLVGYLGVVIAALFFGSNYVPVKKYPSGDDGMYFQWMLCTGILFIGFFTLPFQSHYPILEPSGFLGGGLWAFGNLMVIPIIKRVGLGIGLLLWSGCNLIVGYTVGKTHPFGLAPTPTKNEAVNILGACLAVLSMVCYFFVKSEVQEAEGEAQTALLDPESGPVNAPKAAEEKSTGDRIMGVFLAIVAGICYGFCLVPSQLWYDKKKNEPGYNPKPLDFVFSQCVGIYALSTVAFIIYCLVKRNKPVLFPTTTVPAIISGAMWSIANASFIFANGQLGFATAYPIVAVGPTWVGSAWSVLVFKEIKGVRNLQFLALSLAINLAGVLCIALSAAKQNN